MRTLQAELRRGQQGAVVIDPIALRGVLEAHARLQASRRCMTGATMSVMGTTTPAAGTTPGALGTPAAVTPSTGATSPAALTPAAPAATVAGSIATPRAGTVSAGGATPGAGVTPGALGTPAATPVAGGVSTEERLNGVDRAIQAIQSQLNALFGARPAPAATPGR